MISGAQAPTPTSRRREAAAMIARMRHASEACAAANRFYVQAGIHDVFVAGPAARMRALRVGPGREPDTRCGPMITAQAVRKIDRLVTDALAQGRTRDDGWRAAGARVSIVPPPVLENLAAPFGGVTGILGFMETKYYAVQS